MRLAAECERLRAEVAMLHEELRIKDARLARIPARERPHYPPTERLAILALKAARGCNLVRTSARFLLTPATIASWLRRIDDDGSDALVTTRAGSICPSSTCASRRERRPDDDRPPARMRPSAPRSSSRSCRTPSAPRTSTGDGLPHVLSASTPTPGAGGRLRFVQFPAEKVDGTPLQLEM